MTLTKNTSKKNLLNLLVIFIIFGGLVALGILTSDKDKKDDSKDAENTNSQTETSTFDLDKYMTEVDGEGVASLFAGEELSIIYIMQTGCSYCEQFSPVISKVASEYGLEINYINLANLTETDDQVAYYAAHDLLSASLIGTPTTLIVKDGGIYGILSGAVEEATAIQFFKEHGFIE